MINKLKFDGDISFQIPIGFTIFCDLDETLVRTDYANYLSYKYALMETTNGALDIDFTKERFNREKLKQRFISLSELQLEIITTLKEQYFMEFISQAALNNSLANLIGEHSTKNKLILVTCCRQKRAIEVLKHYKLIEYFNRLICREHLAQDEPLIKYETAIKLTAANPESVIIFENEDVFIEEAVKNGVPRRNIYKISIE